uniref:tRNA (guanine(10)-N(2))-methyltransferase n=1 Tax=Anthurium amnicola TaxID=1678845 RepID=A0A1D1YUQ8_9ARAE
MWFLCVFFHRLLDYRIPEVESLAELFGVFDEGEGRTSYADRHLEWKLPVDHHIDSPFHFVSLPSEEIARKIASRSMLVKGMYELWGQGSSHEELELAIKCFSDERKLPYLSPDSTFRIIVDSFGKVISFEEQNERIRGLRYIPFKGRVDLRNPDHKFWLMETDDYGSNNGLPPVVKKRIFFGREIGAADRKLLPTYQLKSRKYLGPTAMDAEMAFLMANQGLAQPGKLIYDPFVGTGSILVAAAHFGAMTMGADIDIRVVRDGRAPDCNVWSNFQQYGLPMPISLLRADNNLPPWRQGLGEVFDAIICDPPYGVRAGGRKSGGRKLLKGIVGPYTVPEEKRSDHIPSTAPYCLVECMHDLLDLSAKMLVMGGRLVFFYPVVRDGGFTVTQYPEHPCFTMVASCEQILSLRYSRHLLTMVKTSAYSDKIAELARKKHMEFKENHLKWLEDGNLHSAVFSPADPQPTPPGKSERDLKPKYRGKYV